MVTPPATAQTSTPTSRRCSTSARSRPAGRPHLRLPRPPRSTAQRLTPDEILDICYLFFLAGLDTVTASLDCILGYLAQHPEQRRAIVDDPALIPAAIEEMLRWETPVSGVVRITTDDTEIGGCPDRDGHAPSSPLLGSANNDEKAWHDADKVDFDREVNKHLAFGGGVHRCLGSHLARMELRVVLEEWHAAVPDYSLPEGIELIYSQAPPGRQPRAGLVTTAPGRT